MCDKAMFNTPELKIKNQQEQQKSQEHNNTLVPSAPRRSFVEDNTSCDTFTPRRIIEENIPGRMMKPSCKLGESLSNKVILNNWEYTNIL